MTQSNEVEINGNTIEIEWEGQEASGDGFHEPLTPARIIILGSTEDGEPVDLTDAGDAEAIRQIEAELAERMIDDRE